MEKPRELLKTEVEQCSVLLNLLEQAQAHGESLISYHGTLFAIVPVEDITNTFTPEELSQFAADYAAAEKPSNHLTVEEALIRYKRRVRNHGSG